MTCLTTARVWSPIQFWHSRLTSLIGLWSTAVHGMLVVMGLEELLMTSTSWSESSATTVTQGSKLIIFLPRKTRSTFYTAVITSTVTGQHPMLQVRSSTRRGGRRCLGSVFERYQQYCRKFRRLRFAGCVAFAVAYYPGLERECALLPVSKTLPEISSGQRGWRGGEEEIEKERGGSGGQETWAAPLL